MPAMPGQQLPSSGPLKTRVIPPSATGIPEEPMTKRCLALILIVLCSGCGGGTPKVGEPTPITICQYGDLLIYLPLYIAEDKGYFAKQQLKVNFINGGGDDKTFAAVSSGNAQFGVSDPTFAAIAREKGRPAVVVGTVVAGATYWGVTWDKNVRPGSSVAGLKDLRIATYEAPSTNYALMSKSLNDHRAEVGDAKIVEGAYGTLLAMLKAGQADVAMELEPVASLAVKDGAHIVFSYPEMYGPFMLTGLYTLESYRDQNPANVQKVLNALEEAMRFAHQDPMGAVEVARRKFPEIDPGVLRSAVERMINEKTLPQHVSVDPAGWKKTVELRMALGDLKSAAVAEKTIDNSFALNAADSK